MKTLDAKLILKILLLAIPLVISNITVPLVGLINTALIGHLPNPDYLIAMSMGIAIFGFIFQIFFFLRMSAVGLVSQLRSCGKHQETYNIFIQYLLFSVIIGLILIASRHWILTACTHIYVFNNETLSLFKDYLYIRLYSAPAAIASFLFLGFFVGIQKIRHALYMSIIINFFTTLFGILFIFNFDMNISGIAYADVIAQYLGAFYALFFIYQYFKNTNIQFNDIKFLHNIKYLFSMNSDILIRTLLLVSALFIFSVFSSRLGPNVLVINTIILQIQALTALALDGFANATETLCGEFHNQKNKLKNILFNTAMASLITSIFITVIYLFTYHHILALLTSDQYIITMSEKYQIFVYLLPIISVWCFWLDGVFTGLLRTRAMRDTMIFSVVIYVFFAYLSTYLNNYWLFSSLLLLFVLRAITLGQRLKKIFK
ncbi:MATE family efflux transporter [Francisellaceae bacterium]|nr:MATE family efflux transporter [Francisellaceae bacterium]